MSVSGTENTDFFFLKLSCQYTKKKMRVIITSVSFRLR